ncbi:MAG: hypothetical protein MUF18_08500 [Fimbriiglobus sp.]|jgi:hypothetical protein|nr:hypothetical protein [Fimbriiglobus sp.]
MTNRVSDLLPPDPPSNGSADDLADKLRGLRVLCLGMILFGVALLLMVSGVVWFGLGGRSLVKIGGTEVLTAIGAVLTLTAVALAVLLVPVITRVGLRKVATEPPAPPDEGAPPDTELDRLWRVYAQGKFLEYGLADGAGVVTAVLFHLSADWVMLLFVAGMVVFQIVRFPNAAGATAWLAAAKAEVDRVRAGGGE